MPTITQFEYLLAVEQTKSFSRAAKLCHVSQPSLSAQVQKVEEELDIIIFDRSKKPTKTTKAGEKLIQQAKKVLVEYKKVFDLQNDSGVLRGDFHLAVIPSLAPYILPFFVQSFSKKYPEVNLSISEMKTEMIVEALVDDKIDGSLLVTPLKDDQIIERVLFYEKFFVFTSENNDLYKKKSVVEADLNSKSVWLLEEGHCFRDQVIKVCSAGKRKNVLENIKFNSGSLETLINLIRSGQGFTLLPELATLHLSQEEKDRSLRKFRKPIPTREVSFVHSRSFLKQDIIDALQGEIVSNLPKSIRSLKKEQISIVEMQ